MFLFGNTGEFLQSFSPELDLTMPASRSSPVSLSNRGISVLEATQQRDAGVSPVKFYRYATRWSSAATFQGSIFFTNKHPTAGINFSIKFPKIPFTSQMQKQLWFYMLLANRRKKQFTVTIYAVLKSF